jgi:hypothetical protein
LNNKKATRILGEIREIDNDNEHVPRGRDRTNSDNWADNMQFLSNDISVELAKPSKQQVTSFTENMVYMHLPSQK